MSKGVQRVWVWALSFLALAVTLGLTVGLIAPDLPRAATPSTSLVSEPQPAEFPDAHEYRDAFQPRRADPDHPHANNFTFSSFHADYRLTRDDSGRAHLHTVETLTAEFPPFDQNRGIVRALPNRFDGHSTQLEILSVTDGNGLPRGYEIVGRGSTTELHIQEPDRRYQRDTQVYVIEYTQQDVIREVPDAALQEWYWNLNGIGWEQPFERVSADIEFDDEIAAWFSGDAACYRGTFQSGDRCPVERTGDGSFRVDEQWLSRAQNVTVALGFEVETFRVPVQVPEEPEEPSRLTPLLVGGALALLGGAGLLLASVLRRRGLGGAQTTIARYSPPPGMSAPLAAEVLGVSPKRTVPAALLDLAVRKRVRLLHDEATGLYGVQLITRSDLAPEELAITDALFPQESSDGLVWFDRSNPAPARAWEAMRKTAQRRIVELGYRQNLSRASALGVGLIRVFSTVLLIAGLAMMAGHPALRFAIVGFGLMGVIVALNLSRALNPPVGPLTAAGLRVSEHLAGLDEYIRLAEADRIRMLHDAGDTPADRERVLAVSERLLPYAVLFDYTDEWQRVLAPLYSGEGPDWLLGEKTFSTGTSLTSLSRGVGSVISAHSASYSSMNRIGSAGGGSRGGGFSGGGGGGGGGRGL